MAPNGLNPSHFRGYATVASSRTKRHLNAAIDFQTTPLLHHRQETFANTPGLSKGGSSTRLNLYQAVNSGVRTALTTSNKVLCFGEDVAFGGVFNTPMTKQGIVGAAIGAAAEGANPVVEIRFADYVFPAFDQIVNEAAKFRYREGYTGSNLGDMVIRMPCGGVVEHCACTMRSSSRKVVRKRERVKHHAALKW